MLLRQCFLLRRQSLPDCDDPLFSRLGHPHGRSGDEGVKALNESSLANIAAYPSEERSRLKALLDEKFAYAFPGSSPKTKS